MFESHGLLVSIMPLAIVSFFVVVAHLFICTFLIATAAFRYPYFFSVAPFSLGSAKIGLILTKFSYFNFSQSRFSNCPLIL